MPSPVSAALPAVPLSATIARRLVRRVLGRTIPAEQVSTVELLATELVTNAVRHAGTACELELSCPRDHTLRIEVSDHGAGTPTVQAGELTPDGDLDTGEEGGGRGLMLVDTLATAWGVDPVHAAGKTVWFEVRV